MTRSIFSFDTIARPGRREWIAIALVAGVTLLFLPMVVWKVVGLGQGDTQVFFRAGWAVWTGYPLYQITDHHGWTYHYPPTFALFMGPFANPPDGEPQPAWALPFAAAVVVWYLLNALCLMLALHVWANVLERYRPAKARSGFLQGAWALRVGPLFALLPFLGDGLVRGQPTPVLLLLVVLFFALYVEGRLAAAAFAFALAVTIKLFPLVLAILPLMRRDRKFIAWAALWGIALLIGLPVICLGPSATLGLYRVVFNEHLASIVSGSMSPQIASEVSPGADTGIGVGSVVARVAAGTAFYDTPLPGWASAIQFLFNAAVVVTVVMLGRGGFWTWRRSQPASGYSFLVAGSVLFAAIPLMISFAGPQYVTSVVPLIGVLMIEAWRRAGEEVVSGVMIGWSVLAWLSMIALDMPWNWLKLAGPMTWVLLLLAPSSLSLLAHVSRGCATAEPTTADRPVRPEITAPLAGSTGPMP